jgi:DNA ligase-1
MKRFAELYAALDETTKTTAKVDALRRYFEAAPPEDAAWALFFLQGGKLRQPVAAKNLRAWAAQEAGVPDWLFEESYDAVGDLAETVALLLPQAASEDGRSLHWWVEEHLVPLRSRDEAGQRETLRMAWCAFSAGQRFVWNKLITGGFRVGVSKSLVVRALSQATGRSEEALAHRLMGNWTPTAENYQRLFAEDTSDADVSRPYPFYLAHALDSPPEELGPASEWLAEWKWDGIRAQLIRRRGETHLWSRGGELITERFPEMRLLGEMLEDGTVLDGELLAWSGDGPLPFAAMQRRIGRKTLGRKLLAEVPAALIAFDLLEWAGEDLRGRPLRERRERLDALGEKTGLRISPRVVASSWEELAAQRGRARAMGSEGLMLKRLDSPYGAGRERGNWWKWKVNPYTVDAVLMYAQSGHGRRASLYTDYTFGIWKDGALAPFAKAYSGLNDEEIRRVDAFVRRNTIEKFGPVRTVKPELVFEIAFEDLQPSARHKSGVAVRFPRIARWRADKKPEDADTIETVLAMLEAKAR